MSFLPPKKQKLPKEGNKDMATQLDVWTKSQFWENDSDYISHSKRILLQEMKQFIKNIVSYVNKTIS
jgi:hypothetical protein